MKHITMTFEVVDSDTCVRTRIERLVDYEQARTIGLDSEKYLSLEFKIMLQQFRLANPDFLK